LNKKGKLTNWFEFLLLEQPCFFYLSTYTITIFVITPPIFSFSNTEFLVKLANYHFSQGNDIDTLFSKMPNFGLIFCPCTQTTLKIQKAIGSRRHQMTTSFDVSAQWHNFGPQLSAAHEIRILRF